MGYFGLSRSENLNLRKSRFLFSPPSSFPMKMKLPAAISQVLQLFGRSRLGFWMTLGSPFKNTSNLEKYQNLQEITIFSAGITLEISLGQGPPNNGKSYLRKKYTQTHTTMWKKSLIGKHEGGQTQNRDFLKFRFSDLESPK